MNYKSFNNRVLVFGFICFFSLIYSSPLYAACTSSAFEKRNVIAGDEKAAAIMYHLGILPSGWSGLRDNYDKSSSINLCTDFVGCSKGLLGVKKDVVKKKLEKFKDYPVFITTGQSDLLLKHITGEKLKKQFESFGMETKVIDLSKGIVPALSQAGKYFNLEKKAAFKVKEYEKYLKRTDSKITKVEKGKKVLILKGIYQKATGKGFVSVETAGGYTDKYILEKFGAENIANGFFTEEEIKNSDNGQIIIREKRLLELLKKNPDMVVAMGDSFSVEEIVYSAAENLKNKVRIFSLPFYSGSDLLSYPSVMMKWYKAFEAVK